MRLEKATEREAEEEGLIVNVGLVLKNPKMYVGMERKERRVCVSACVIRKEQLRLDRPGFL